MASNELTVANVKRALEIAREAMELDAEESRLRGRSAASPDLASVGTLAAGILVANALAEVRRGENGTKASRPAQRRRTARVPAST